MEEEQNAIHLLKTGACALNIGDEKDGKMNLTFQKLKICFKMWQTMKNVKDIFKSSLIFELLSFWRRPPDHQMA